ncbi:Holliday junction branch migration protein RuvA [Clostridium sp. AF18-27]|uniref:Holliday junction branch migration protein RuvA n=1 Tax=Enterocloster lavalensis TaxID=460384 RepID=UPI000D1A2B6D|nr:Holliday junction branch migration protein RuvA [Enterocloster lavalensis]MBS5603984.1 Holliday junction branch migration protein RuvA [Enterocloster asparagiformis]MCB6345207.1 Holliday junction branch migration protein RuvA [Enterocloster lavalensis]PST35262.1 Holliday junction branch migration protein RuvA [Enterocloster lavalensis]RHR53552.1 Holliday junction branch migration protein RuvA [Clostridium sp. AF18-27]
MISYIKGPLTAIEEDVIVVEAGGVGMGIHVPLSVLDRLPGIGREVTVYTYFQVREDAMSLYGFLNRQDREMFRQLIGVNGVGPKAALGILSTMTPDDLRMAIVTGDAKAISRAPGIGPKTAQRLILDLKDKVSMEEVLGNLALPSDGGASAALGTIGMGEAAKEAVQALVALGYSNMEANKAVKQVEVTETMTAEDVLKASLRYLSF